MRKAPSLLLCAGAVAVAALVAAAPDPASAAPLEPPTGPVILVVTGKIENTNAPGEARFDQAMLEKLGLATIATPTTWTQGVVAFEGVLARRVMQAVAAKGREAIAVALNDYQTRIPLTDFERRDVLLALRQDGKPMRVRDKGPIWIIYPKEAGTDSHSLETRGKMVWQLKELRIQ